MRKTYSNTEYTIECIHCIYIQIVHSEIIIMIHMGNNTIDSVYFPINDFELCAILFNEIEEQWNK